MASKIYNIAKQLLLNGGLDLNTDDIRVALVMTNTTCDTEQDGMATIDDFTTLDEADGTNYVRKQLASEAVNLDDANDRAEFDAADVTWTALGSGTRELAGAVIYKHVTDDTDSIPIAWIEFSSSQDPAGVDFVITWNAEGIIQAA